MMVTHHRSVRCAAILASHGAFGVVAADGWEHGGGEVEGDRVVEGDIENHYRSDQWMTLFLRDEDVWPSLKIFEIAQFLRDEDVWLSKDDVPPS
ncbi:hypothetical protein F3Y22_tig00116964pilonHSYRG00195 [Hibiscus syriacus]|uniref:Uncharacterized protein n=1 Tax=Hibiscus syriacus TaxID=106335 RepID=A0A6A2WJE1_HIBSY|nr:hypothetical protein F3Y22_tig00116964pilonHSYRG00195 [Hibiscus syriacus]